MDRRTTGWALVVLQFALLIALVLVPRRPVQLVGLAIGVPVVAAGAVLGLAASRRLGSALTPTPVPIAGAGLRTTGVYARLRHPIYSAVLLVALGYVVIMGSAGSALVAVLLLVLLWAKSRWEDRLLREQYGSAWEQWASSTGALVPRRRLSR